MHPDKAGGLQPLGQLGLRNQYALTLMGLYIVVVVAVGYHFLDFSGLVMGFSIALIITYMLFGPLLFLAPLLPFRGAMLRSKAQLMREVALRLRVELDHLHARLPSGAITAEDEAMIERLRKIAAVIDELRVWPFDATTLRKFLTAYVIPLASSIGLPAIKAVIDYLHIRLPLLS